MNSKTLTACPGKYLKHLSLLFAALFMICFFSSNRLYATKCMPTVPTDSAINKNKFLKVKLDTEVDSILVVKRFRHMYVFNHGLLLKVYNISLGESPIGPKHFQGDRKTPEGLYYIDHKNPYSMAHKSLAISYPNNKDRQFARKYGKPTGGDVMIHGILNGDEANAKDYVGSDWTWGCIAITNEEVDELFTYVKLGAPINILP